jgi:hypothetical protein
MNNFKTEKYYYFSAGKNLRTSTQHDFGFDKMFENKI